MKKINLTIKQINDTVNELTKSNTIIFISGKTIKGQFNTSISFKTYFNNKNGFKTEILNTRSCNIIWDKLIKMGYEWNSTFFNDIVLFREKKGEE